MLLSKEKVSYEAASVFRLLFSYENTHCLLDIEKFRSRFMSCFFTVANLVFRDKKYKMYSKIYVKLAKPLFFNAIPISVSKPSFLQLVSGNNQ